MSKSRPAAVYTELSGRSSAVLAVLCGAIFLEGIDVAMLNVALPSIRADLGLSTGMLSGVVSAYVLGYGGFMLLGGRAADLLGRRRMFLLWLTVSDWAGWRPRAGCYCWPASSPVSPRPSWLRPDCR